MEQDHSVRDREPAVGLAIVTRPQDRIMDNRSSTALVAEVSRVVAGEASRLAVDEGEGEDVVLGALLPLRQRIIPLLPHLFR